jgi:hypothetical protein
MRGETHGKTHHSIELCSGDYLDLLNPDYRMITPEVLAHHLSQCNRFAGATRRPYSVGEHTLLVASYLKNEGHTDWVQLAGLHHDDSEAFLHDLTRPLKDQIPPYKPIERKMAYAIEKALKLGDAHPDEITVIKDADNWALSAEAWYLMPSRGIGWWSEGIFDPNDSDHVRIARPMATSLPIVSTQAIAQHWLRQHRSLIEAAMV